MEKKMYKAVIEETRRKVIFIEASDEELATSQYDAGIWGDLPEKDNKKFIFTDTDDGVEYTNCLVSIKETDMEKEEEYAERYYEFPEVVYWNDECNCQTSGWNN